MLMVSRYLRVETDRLLKRSHCVSVLFKNYVGNCLARHCKSPWKLAQVRGIAALCLHVKSLQAEKKRDWNKE